MVEHGIYNAGALGSSPTGGVIRPNCRIRCGGDLITSSSDAPGAEISGLKKLGSLNEEQQAAITRWLESEHFVLLELYQSLCALIYGEAIPGRARLIAHCIREIRNILWSHIVAEESSHLQYPNEIDPIARDWDETGQYLDGLTGEDAPTITPTSTNANVQIGLELALKIHRLIKQHNSTRTANIEKTIRLFENFQKSNPEGVTSLEVLARNWKSLTDWFLKITHERDRTDGDIIDDEFIRKVNVFEKSMHNFATAPAFFEGLKEIDEILEQANA